MKSIILLISIFLSTQLLSQNVKLLSDEDLIFLSQNACKCIEEIELTSTLNIDKPTDCIKVAFLTNATSLGIPKINIKNIGQFFSEVRAKLNENCKNYNTFQENRKNNDSLGTSNKKALSYFLKAEQAQKQKQYNRATKFYKKTLKEDKTYLNASNELALSLELSKKHNRAILVYKKQLEINPNNGNAMYSLGRLYNVEKEYSKAINWYNKALAIDEKDSKVHYGLGLTYGNSDDLEKSLQHLISSHQLSKEEEVVYYESRIMIDLLRTRFIKQDMVSKFIDICKKRNFKLDI